MPNWVANHLIIHGENAVEILHSLLSKRDDENEAGCGYDLDFNKIIPMPESLNIESGSTTNSCVELYLTSINPFVDYYGDNKVEANEYMEIFRAVQATKAYGKFNDRLPIEEIQIRENETSIWNGPNDIHKFTKDEILDYGKTAVDNVLTYGAMDWYDWCVKNWGTKWNACRTQIPDEQAAEVYFDTAWSPVPALTWKLSELHEHYDENSKECYEMFFRLWGGKDDYKFNEKTGAYEYIENEAVM